MVLFILRGQNPDGIYQRLCVRPSYTARRLEQASQCYVSAPRPVVTDVPQACILAPLIFIIYINNLPNCHKHCITNTYPDDTAICVSINPFGPEFTIVIFIHYEPRIAVAILDL